MHWLFCFFLEWLRKRVSPMLFISAFNIRIYIRYTWKVCCGKYCITSWYRTFSILKHPRRFDFKLGLLEPTFNWICSIFGFSSLPKRFFFSLFLLGGSCLTFLLLRPEVHFCAGVQSIKYCNPVTHFQWTPVLIPEQASNGPSFSYQANKCNNVDYSYGTTLRCRR